MNKIKKIFGFFNRTALLYFLAAVILFALADLKTANMRRLNSMGVQAGQYPIDFFQKKSPFDSLRFRRAIRYYQLVSNIYPDFARVYGAIGYCNFYLKKYNRAVYFYEKAIRENQKFYWLKWDLGCVYFAQNDFRKAAEFFKEVAFEDLTALVRFSILSDLKNFDNEKRKAFIEIAKKFAIESRIRSQQMFVLSLKSLKDYEGVLNVVKLSTQDELKGDEAFFFYQGAVALYYLGIKQEAVFFLKKSIGFEKTKKQSYLLLKIMEEESKGVKTVEAAQFLEKLLKEFHGADKILDDQVDKALVFHPWSNFIPIGMERFY